MKVVKFLLSFSITLALAVAFSTKINDIPPLGKFLDPFHGFWQNAESLDTDLERSLSFSTLSSPVTILYDSLLIPHIFASNEEDLFFAQGYTMASLRLWQMEFVTHVAAGRVSEIVGAQALYLDRLNRRKGLMYAAENNLKVWMQDPDIQRQVEAYSRGVNAYISSLTYESLPIEYKLLNYRPEAWAPIKSVLLLSYMTDMLAGGDADLQNTNALRLLGKENFDLLFPTDLPNPATIIPESREWEFDAVELDTPRVVVADTTDFIMDIIDQPDPDNGSNNWAVSGSKTRNGKPILAGDPHLGLNIPSIWTAMQLNAPGLNVMGVTLPGTPGIIIGFNDSIAWSPTNAKQDVLDWYKIRFSNLDKSEYVYDNKQLKTQQRIEEIVRQLEDIGGTRQMGYGPNRIASLPDAIARILKEYLTQTDEIPATEDTDASHRVLNQTLQAISMNGEKSHNPIGDICPECGAATLIRKEGCVSCHECGYSEC